LALGGRTALRNPPVHPLLMGLALVPLVIAFVLLLEWLLR
jgi:hypothetical protein